MRSLFWIPSRDWIRCGGIVNHPIAVDEGSSMLLLAEKIVHHNPPACTNKKCVRYWWTCIDMQCRHIAKHNHYDYR